MSRAVKALLLSALLFPGLGHLYLGKHLRGLIFLSITAAALFYMFQLYTTKVQPLIDKIVSGQIAPDPVVITLNLQQSFSSQDTLHLNIASWSILIAWILSMLDSYYLGRRLSQQDEEQQA